MNLDEVFEDTWQHQTDKWKEYAQEMFYAQLSAPLKIAIRWK